MTLVVGHLGMPGAGKGTISAFFAEFAKRDGYTVAELRFSDPLRETLQRLSAIKFRGDPNNQKTMRIAGDILRDVWDIDTGPRNVRTFLRLMAAHFGDEGDIAIDRPNLQKLPVVMQPAFGKSVLSHAVFFRAGKRNEDLVQVDGVRWLTDESALKALPNAQLCYTKASFAIRGPRMLARMRDGEDKKTLEQLAHEDSAENERYIPDIGTRAHFEIENESDSMELLKSVAAERYAQHLQPRLQKKAAA